MFLLALSFGWSACTGDEPAQKIDLSKREAVEVRDADDAITYAYLPQYFHFRFLILRQQPSGGIISKKKPAITLGRFFRTRLTSR